MEWVGRGDEESEKHVVKGRGRRQLTGPSQHQKMSEEDDASSLQVHDCSISSTSTEYMSARTKFGSSTDVSYRTALGSDYSLSSTVEDQETTSIPDQSTLIGDDDEVDYELADVTPPESWQDLEHDTVGTWVGPSPSDALKETLIMEFTKRREVKVLKQLAQYQGGLVTDKMRRQVWPIISKTSVIATSPRPDEEVMKDHPFYTQVCLDVNRSLKRFPPSVGESQRMAMQDQLILLIMRILIKNPTFYYYQGYHDICITFLLILGPELAFHVVNSLSESHLKVFMEKSMENTSILLDIIPVLVEKEHEGLGHFLRRSGVGTIFALSWVITWFSHVLRNYETVGRLFDLFIASHPLMSVYLTASILLYRSDALLGLDCDMASVHQYLTRFIEEDEDDLPFELLIQDAKTLLAKYPPEEMEELVKEKKKIMKQNERRRQQLEALSNLFKMKGLVSFLFSKKGLISLSVAVALIATSYSYIRSNRIVQQ